ncbi:tripartite tricarboxylate transporter substrate binding protein [Ramlibacter sp.]|uniref:tripartite tricarboxylate transporter substrate binding protein n=1 Tax=Ramlibacter sp. TaxID=1917967 RepID=UPI003D13AAB6
MSNSSRLKSNDSAPEPKRQGVQRGRRVLLGLAAAGGLLGFAQNAVAQAFPSKPIRIVVAFAPGGTSDVLGRHIAKQMSAQIGQSVVIENKPGASGVIGADFVAKAAPDGYTIGMINFSHAAIPAVTKTPYDLKDLTPISMIGTLPVLVSVNAAVPVKNLQELIAMARSKPGGLSYANAGTLTAGHLAMEMLKFQAGVDVVAVNYKGGGPAMNDLVAGQVQIGAAGPTAHLPFIKAGKLRPIATTGPKRSTILPDTPTMSESGLSGFDLNDWYGMFAPPGTPAPIVAELNRQLVLALQAPEVRNSFATLGAEAGGSSPEELARFTASEMDKLRKLATSIKLKVE